MQRATDRIHNQPLFDYLLLSYKFAGSVWQILYRANYSSASFVGNSGRRATQGSLKRLRTFDKPGPTIAAPASEVAFEQRIRVGFSSIEHTFLISSIANAASSAWEWGNASRYHLRTLPKRIIWITPSKSRSNVSRILHSERNF